MPVCGKLSGDSRERILEVAERLFAFNGYKDTTIAQLACEAKVNLAAVNYHFGSKRALIEQVIERHLPLIRQRCLEELQRIRKIAIQHACQPDIKDILRAFIEPALDVKGKVQNNIYFLLIVCRCFYSHDDTIRNIFTRHVADTFQLCLELMRDALPNMPERALLWRINFAMGSLSHAMHLCGCQFPSTDIFPAIEDVKYVVTQLLSFLTCGIKAPCHEEDDIMPDVCNPVFAQLMELEECDD